MLYLACTTISSVDLAQYGVSLAKDWVSVKCDTTSFRWHVLARITHLKQCRPLRKSTVFVQEFLFDHEVNIECTNAIWLD